VRYFIHFLLLLGFINPIFAQSIEAVSFNNTKQEARYQNLIDEIRCPVCQGQSIGGSNAGLAQDLRKKVRELILKDKNDTEIAKFMTDRYGDFAVFTPPVRLNTYLLWFSPFIFLALGFFVFMRSFKQTPAQPIKTVDTSKADALLK
jgi:cytochrome c-type biogenesis protein CcmH